MNELNQLLQSFLQQYTFNNIDILLSHRKILNLDKDSLFDKLINRQRGGYCFENNQYFFNLLKDQGYDVQRYLGRVVYGGGNDVPRTHQISVVNQDGEKFIVDVGFGPYTPGVSVPLTGSLVKAFNGNQYRIVKLDNHNFQLETLRDNQFFSLYQFDLATYVAADFKIANYYTNTHDDSKFTTSLTLSQLNERGVKLISNFLFSTIYDGERKDFSLEKIDNFMRVINDEFSVSYTMEELEKLYYIVQKLV
jgi:N-hydroxyarylamine O-acetyltransferase